MKLFLLFALIAVSHAAWSATANYCGNPFLGQLEKDNVTIHQAPVMGTFGHCQAEWNRYGSCCESASLIAMFKGEKRQTEVNRIATAKTIEDIEVLIDSILKKVNRPAIANRQSIASRHRKKKNRKSKSKSKSKTSKGSVMSAANRNIKATAERFAEEKLLNMFNSSSKTCWEQMSDMRGSALCSICSGRSKVFFKEEKALVCQNDCMTAIDTCEDFYLDVAHFFVSLKNTIDALDKSFDFGKESKMLHAFGNQLTKFILPAGFINEFIAYNKATKITKPKVAISICQKILNIRRSTYLDSVANTFIPTFLDLIYASQNSTGVLNSEFNKTRDRWSHSGYSYDNNKWSHHSYHDKSDQNSYGGNWFSKDSQGKGKSSHQFTWHSGHHGRGSRRLITAPSFDSLTLAQPDPLFFNADTLIVQGDGMFDDVAGKDPLMSSLSSFPMNLTLAFP